MNTQQIVDTLNEHFVNLGNSKVHFIVLRRVEPNPTFTAYKEYEYTLWYVNKETKYKVLKFSQTGRVTNEEEVAKMLELMKEQLLLKIFEMLQNKELVDSLLDGTFKGIEEEV